MLNTFGTYEERRETKESYILKKRSYLVLLTYLS